MPYPPDIRIHQLYSPRKIIMNRNLEYMKNCKVEFDTYAETRDDATPTNTVAERPKEAIFLGATKNFQSSCKLLCLRTRQRITRKQLTSQPMPQSVIKKWKIWPSRITTKRIIPIMICTGGLFNGRVIQISHVHSFITLICLSTYGTCYADAVVFKFY